MTYKIETLIDVDEIEYIYDKDTEIAINSKNVKFIDSHKNYDGVCFNYALNDNSCLLNGCYDAYKELEIGYKQIDIKNAKKGDIVSYHEVLNLGGSIAKTCAKNSLHFAIIEKTDGTINGTIIKSKWGYDGIFETTIYDVPNVYGNTIVIWRKEESNG